MADLGLDELRRRLAVTVSDDMLTLALTHRSFAYEAGGIPTNERLEFLGDSVLGLVVTDTLYRTFPDLPEGQLARMRAAVVSAKALAEVGRTFGVGDFLRLGRGEQTTGGREKASILADTTEAIIGAVYVEQGLPMAQALVHRMVDPMISRAGTLGAGLDWKSSLQELTAARGLGPPDYRVEWSGPAHDRTFTAHVVIDAIVSGTGQGRSKKDAENSAAKLAWERLTEGQSESSNA